MLTTFTTETGSVYELDEPGKRMRRLSGSHEVTRNQRSDGEWRDFVSCTPPTPGEAVLVVWGVEVEGGVEVVRRTITSPVVDVETNAPSGARA